MSFTTEKIPGTPLYKSRTPQVAQGTLLLADLNTGLVILAPNNRLVQITGFMFHMNGTFAGLTDMRLQTTELPTPTPLITVVAAQMGDTVIHTEAFGTHVLAPAYWIALPKGTGLQLVKTGAPATGGTSVDYAVHYVFEG
jgi:hypothetical protein